jgi:hypothetical protein
MYYEFFMLELPFLLMEKKTILWKPFLPSQFAYRKASDILFHHIHFSLVFTIIVFIKLKTCPVTIFTNKKSYDAHAIIIRYLQQHKKERGKWKEDTRRRNTARGEKLEKKG